DDAHQLKLMDRLRGADADTRRAYLAMQGGEEFRRAGVDEQVARLHDFAASPAPGRSGSANGRLDEQRRQDEERVEVRRRAQQREDGRFQQRAVGDRTDVRVGDGGRGLGGSGATGLGGSSATGLGGSSATGLGGSGATGLGGSGATGLGGSGTPRV